MPPLFVFVEKFATVIVFSCFIFEALFYQYFCLLSIQSSKKGDFAEDVI